MAGIKGNRPSRQNAKLHAERLERHALNRRLADLRAEAERLERKQNGTGEPNVVLGVQLAKELQSWRAEFDKRNERMRREDNVMGAIEWLSEMTGIDPRRINGIMRSEFKTVGESQAELILAVIDRMYLLGGQIRVIPNPNWSLERWTAYMEEQGCI